MHCEFIIQNNPVGSTQTDRLTPSFSIECRQVITDSTQKNPNTVIECRFAFFGTEFVLHDQRTWSGIQSQWNN
jgi:hypothetical protein